MKQMESAGVGMQMRSVELTAFQKAEQIALRKIQNKEGAASRKKDAAAAIEADTQAREARRKQKMINDFASRKGPKKKLKAPPAPTRNVKDAMEALDLDRISKAWYVPHDHYLRWLLWLVMVRGWWRGLLCGFGVCPIGSSHRGFIISQPARITCVFNMGLPFCWTPSPTLQGDRERKVSESRGRAVEGGAGRVASTIGKVR
jgi:hypothetical protein